jgi:spermidine synthase
MSIFAAVTHGLTEGKEQISVMVIGGGGYVFPRYVEEHWRGSSIDVVEIDRGVTKAAVEAFGLRKDSTINTITMDARSYVDQLLEKKRNGHALPRYDFVYEDAVNDYSVPYQLVTKEFHDKIAEVLTDKGVYLVNLIDIFESGRLLGSFVNTLKKTFPCVHVFSQVAPTNIHNTFVVVAAKYERDIGDVVGPVVRGMDIWCLDNAEISELIRRSGEVVLTDDYAPVEHLLAPVVRRSAPLVLRERTSRRAPRLRR